MKTDTDKFDKEVLSAIKIIQERHINLSRTTLEASKYLNNTMLEYTSVENASHEFHNELANDNSLLDDNIQVLNDVRREIFRADRTHAYP